MDADEVFFFRVGVNLRDRRASLDSVAPIWWTERAGCGRQNVDMPGDPFPGPLMKAGW